MKLSLINES